MQEQIDTTAADVAAVTKNLRDFERGAAIPSTVSVSELLVDYPNITAGLLSDVIRTQIREAEVRLAECKALAFDLLTADRSTLAMYVFPIDVENALRQALYDSDEHDRSFDIIATYVKLAGATSGEESVRRVSAAYEDALRFGNTVLCRSALGERLYDAQPEPPFYVNRSDIENCLGTATEIGTYVAAVAAWIADCNRELGARS